MLRTGATRQSESLMAYESLRRTAAAVSARHHHLRHLQENNDNDATTSNSHLFVQSLVFFAMMVAVFIVVWLVTKVICRALLQFGPSTTNGVAHQFHHRSGGANHNDNDQHHVGSANDHTSLRWTEQEMRQLQSWGIPLETLRAHNNNANNRMRRNLVVMLNDGVSPEETAERRAFLEHALMDHTYEGPADDGATAAEAATAAATETDSNIQLQTDAESSAICCPICLDEFQTGDRVSGSYNRRCHHKFHHECILDWLVHDDTCPCCRQSFLEFMDDEDDATAIDDESKTATATPPAAAASTAALASPSASEEQAEITTTALVVEGDDHSRAMASESRAIATSNDEAGGTYLVEESTPEMEQSRQDIDGP